MPLPLYIYDNWSAYDELSDDVPLTEELAMRQFEEVCRLRRCGVTVDAYLMDAFWYAAEGGYRTWKSDRWPEGPDRWLAACRREAIAPGLWVTANTAFQLDPPPAWRDSLAPDGWGFSCTSGGFLAGFMEVLELWYARGVRVFKFDFADFNVGGDRTANERAYRAALSELRRRCPEVVLLAYNGFEHTEFMPWTDRPVRPVLDRGWLDVFDTVYCGDPRPSDIPLADFWRTLDVYADAMIHLLHRGSGLALREIDNCAFMIGRCGTCYRRGSEGWRTTALLSHARGGRVHVTMGNVEALSDCDAKWLATVQRAYAEAGEPTWVGGNPGAGELYAYAAGPLLTAVNPGLPEKTLVAGSDYRLVFADGSANLSEGTLRLGPGAVAVLSSSSAIPDFGRYLGIPGPLAPLDVKWKGKGQAMEAEVPLSAGTDLHMVFRQLDKDGKAVRTSGGAPPSGIPSTRLLRIHAAAEGRPIEVDRPDDKVAWSGLSWAYGIVRRVSGSVHVRFETDEPACASIDAHAYATPSRAD